jgi:hypothetical protein
MTYLKQIDGEILCSNTASSMPIWVKFIYGSFWLLSAFLWITQDDAKINIYLFYVVNGIIVISELLQHKIKVYTTKINIKKFDNQQVIREVMVSFAHHTTLDDEDKTIPKIVANWHHAGMNLNIKSSITDKKAIEYLDLPIEKGTISKPMQLIYCKNKPYLYYLRYE